MAYNPFFHFVKILLIFFIALNTFNIFISYIRFNLFNNYKRGFKILYNFQNPHGLKTVSSLQILLFLKVASNGCRLRLNNQFIFLNFQTKDFYIFLLSAHFDMKKNKEIDTQFRCKSDFHKMNVKILINYSHMSYPYINL